MTAPVAQECRLEIRRVLSASRAAVFAAWTQPARLREWFAPPLFQLEDAEADVRPGGRYRLCLVSVKGSRHVASGTYVEVAPGRKLVFTWGWEGEPWAETLVTVSLRSLGRRTEFFLTHERFPSPEARANHALGWQGCLDHLEAGLTSAESTGTGGRA